MLRYFRPPLSSAFLKHCVLSSVIQHAMFERAERRILTPKFSVRNLLYPGYNVNLLFLLLFYFAFSFSIFLTIPFIFLFLTLSLSFCPRSRYRRIKRRLGRPQRDMQAFKQTMSIVPRAHDTNERCFKKP